MPGIEDWINSPLQIIKGLFEESSDAHNVKVRQYFEKKLADKTAMSWIPCLNEVPQHNLRTNTLVRFRGMIQDMYDPEYYLGVYEVENKKNGQTRLVSGKFSDLAECGPNEEIKLESPKNKTMERQTVYCVPIPGENTWVKELFSTHGKTSGVATTSAGGDRLKRPLENDAMDPEPTETLANGQGEKSDTASDDVTMETDTAGESTSDGKKSKTDSKASTATNSTPDLNFPLPGEKGPACIVKLYENTDSFKVNDMLEIVGVISNDPALASFPDGNKDESSSLIDPGADMEGIEEQNAHSPPPSLVPRLHVILSRKMQHNNPLLPEDVEAESSKLELESPLQDVRKTREELLAVLTQALLGDKLAAEYTLSHLLSSVYARHDVVAVGKFSLNLIGCPKQSVPEKLYSLLQQLVTKSHFLPMTLSNLNTLKYTPHKDYKLNRLATGLLQLSDHTNLVLDETAMQPGQLDATGVKNITSLGNLLTWQRVDYDFQFHQQPFPTDVRALVLSEGKSLLKCDCRIPIVAEVSADKVEEQFVGIESYLTPALLTKLRTYLGLVQLLPYKVPDDLQKEMEEDFVNRRKEDPNNMTVDDFQCLLVLTRLLSLSFGESTACRETWRRARTLEGLRKQRIPNTPA